MRHGTATGVGFAVGITVASWFVFPATAAAPSRTAAPPSLASASAVSEDVAAPAPGSATTSTVAPAPAPMPDAGAIGADLRRALNEVRAAEGLAPLATDPVLAAMGQGWAAELAAEGGLRHSALIYEVIDDPAWTAAGENVGYGPTVDALVDAFVASPSHRENIVNPRYLSVGIGVVLVDDVIWTAHLFAG